MFIGYHITNQGIYTSENDFINKPPYLGFLLEQYPTAQKVFYDLDSSVASLLSLLDFTENEATRLLKRGKFYDNGYKYTYFPKHFFALDYGAWDGHPSCSFANMNQVGYLTPTYHENETLEDNFNKAKLAKETAIKVCNTFKSLGLGDNIISPLSALKRNFNLDFPSLDYLPPELLDLAYKAVCGQWFESYCMGKIDNCYDYDINGSYAYCMSNIPDIRHCYIKKSTEIPNNAILGLASGTINIDAEFHPFITQVNDDNFTPTGKYPRLMTLSELKFLYRWKLGTYKINSGYWVIPKKLTYPYRGIMNWLWTKKQGTQGNTRDIITRLYSSLWGSQLQIIEKNGEVEFGELFNSLIGLTTEVNSRLHVAEECFKNKIKPHAIMADGFVTDKECDLPLSKKLGEWKLSAKGNCIIIGSGAIVFEKENQPEGLALNYNDLLNSINANPNSNEYIRSKYSPITLDMALQKTLSDNPEDYEFTFNQLGEIREVKRTLTIGDENKRIYYEKPETGKDLISGKIYYSSPINYSLLQNNLAVLPTV
jgi:hypothetical protein